MTRSIDEKEMAGDRRDSVEREAVVRSGGWMKDG